MVNSLRILACFLLGIRSLFSITGWQASWETGTWFDIFAFPQFLFAESQPKLMLHWVPCKQGREVQAHKRMQSKAQWGDIRVQSKHWKVPAANSNTPDAWCVCFFSTNWRKDKDAIARTPEHQNVLKFFFQLCKFSWFDFYPGLSVETSDNLKVFRELGSHMAQKYFLSGRRKRTYCENNTSISFNVRVWEGKRI